MEIERSMSLLDEFKSLTAGGQFTPMGLCKPPSWNLNEMAPLPDLLQLTKSPSLEAILGNIVNSMNQNPATPFTPVSQERKENSSPIQDAQNAASPPTHQIQTHQPHHREESKVSSSRAPMKSFPPEKVENFKHVIYNLLVEAYNNNNSDDCLILPCTANVDGEERPGFKFNDKLDPEKRLPELYAQHIRHARLDLENQDSIFIQDLYKFYLRYALELLGKYFEKAPATYGKYTFLYDPDAPFFVAGGSLREAEERIKGTKTRARRKEKSNTKRGSNSDAPTPKRRRG